MSGWDELLRELDAWGEQGRTATLWWRDDDAVTVTPALERLLAIGNRSETPVALAVIPRDTGEDLARRLKNAPQVAVLQHGFSHDNHAPFRAVRALLSAFLGALHLGRIYRYRHKKREYGPDRSIDVMLAELARGRSILKSFGNALPVMVPPWNVIDTDLVQRLPEIGLTAVSTSGPRQAADAAPGVRQTNVHIDIVDWSGPRFLGLQPSISRMTGHLTARRLGTVDASEPTGLMTHHRSHDEGCWCFIEELLERTRCHAAARWVGAYEAFWP